ncbi:MAG: prolyl oligopeptidase family serine peptidase [Eubacteriaceae bacterium]|nr:prolyl oligopeptidase family serine peptidase [Eubacteriaceae bacterium]
MTEDIITSADRSVKNIFAYGFIDLEGAKVYAIILEYDRQIDSRQDIMGSYLIDDYVMMQEREHGFGNVIEIDGDDIPGNEGALISAYVTDECADTGVVRDGRYVVLRVNTAYMLCGQNLPYTYTMAVSAQQTGSVKGVCGTIEPSDKVFSNYSMIPSSSPFKKGEPEAVAAKDSILLPEFGPDSGWTLHRKEDGTAFRAAGCYSEYDGEYHDFLLPYGIYVPSGDILESNRGKVCLVIHMEHAGANDEDPMAALTSSRAAAILSSKDLQQRDPSIVIVPQIEEIRRTTDDMCASSEANPAIWQLIDQVLKEYGDYIDDDRIYATGQSMGGMAALYMASQRDNFFAAIAVAGAQWSNSYDKPYQHGGAAARCPLNDPVSFRGPGVDPENHLNWYYMISDDNILAVTCADDIMASAQWDYTQEYLAHAGAPAASAGWDPYLPADEQYELERSLTEHDTSAPGGGINRIKLTRGTHMSTWKYAYQLTYTFEWLFERRRSEEVSRPKAEGLKSAWLGRGTGGMILPGSGTAGLNSAQYTPKGASQAFAEGWKRP